MGAETEPCAAQRVFVASRAAAVELYGADGLREFARPKAITKRRARSLLPATSFERTPKQVEMIRRVIKTVHGRKR